MHRSRGGSTGTWPTGRVIGLVVLVAILGAAPSRAQVAVRLRADAASMRQAVSGFEPRQRSAEGTFDVVALRVEFQPDTTRFTTGDGTFGGPLFTDGLEASIDPLPHDAAYFEAHLAFLEHYVSAVSHGRATVRTHLLPGIVRVAGPMGAYSPTGPDADSDAKLSRLANFTREAWVSAPQSAGLPPLNPDRTAFVIFHAGVGRDIELTGTTLDKTPEDLPSLYFDRAALDRLAPGPPASVGGIEVSNTLVIPRTETRQGFDFIADEPFLAEFSINGMLAASFLNFLGVPDLFDTLTGESAIGPFGLMDGQGIFAMSGLFPPRPSAWTRLWLGWADPEIVEAGDATQLTLSSAEPRVALVPVSDAEYFLAEVRHRDPNGSGVRLTVFRDGAEQQIVFENGDETFNPQVVDGFPGGVVTSAEPYDFALPGGLDEDGGELLGGVLIWHVDERVLEEGLADNRINADPERRAVDVEEADGAQDIGHPTGGFFGPAFHLGSPFDFWYEGNPVAVITSTGSEITLYENRFGPDTVPSSASNGGGPSFVEIGDFSAAGPTMQLTVRRASGLGVAPVDGLGAYLDLEAAEGVIKPLGGGAVVYGVGDDGQAAIALVDETGGVSLPDVDLLAAEPAVLDGAVFALTVDGFVRIGSDGTVSPAGDADIAGATTQVVATPDGMLRAGVETADGYRLLECSAGVCATTGDLVVGIAVTDDGEAVRVGVSQARLGDEVWSYPALDAAQRIRPAFGRDSHGYFGVVPDPATNRLHLLRPDGSVLTIDVGASPGSAPVLVDSNGDRRLEVVVPVGSELRGYESSGAVVAGFPVRLRAPGTSVLATGQENWVFLVGTDDGYLEAVDLSTGARPVAGFPLAVGAEAFGTPLVAGNRIWALSAAGRLGVWDVEAGLRDAQALSDDGNTAFLRIPPTVPAGEPPPAFILDPAETYNWPNPVNGGPTHIRFRLTGAARVSISIMDLTGRTVDQIEVPDPDVGVPVEVLWPADVPSGVYIARVKASALDATATETRLVRMAVIR